MCVGALYVLLPSSRHARISSASFNVRMWGREKREKPTLIVFRFLAAIMLNVNYNILASSSLKCRKGWRGLISFFMHLASWL